MKNVLFELFTILFIQQQKCSSTMKFLNTFSSSVIAPFFIQVETFFTWGLIFSSSLTLTLSLPSALCHTKAHTIALKSCLSDPAVRSVCIPKNPQLLESIFWTWSTHIIHQAQCESKCDAMSWCHGPSLPPNQVYLQLVCHHVCHQMTHGFWTLYNIGNNSCYIQKIFCFIV